MLESGDGGTLAGSVNIKGGTGGTPGGSINLSGGTTKDINEGGSVILSQVREVN